MVLNPNFTYTPLTEPTQTRVLAFYPTAENGPIHCFHLVIDLDADWELADMGATAQPTTIFNIDHQLEILHENGTVSVESRTCPLHAEEAGDECKIHPFQKYMAFSYVWGDQTNPRKIFLNNKPFYVGQNLYAVLDRFRPGAQLRATRLYCPLVKEGLMGEHDRVPSAGNLLWIDAMCINQNDRSEREAQVKLMGRIFRQAAFVHADLGNPSTTLEETLQFASLLNTIIKAGVACHDSCPEMADNCLENHGLHSSDDEIWTYWRQLIGSQYFRRLWIVQEYALAKRIAFWSGGLSIDPDMIAGCLELMENYSAGELPFLAVKNAPKSDIVSLGKGIEALKRLELQRHRVQAAKTSPVESRGLLQSLMLSRVTEATDPRDKIYGMLSLASDETNFLHLVSYSRPVPDVFGDFARQFVQMGQGIEMLYQVDYSESGMFNLPSWIPDWSRDAFENPLSEIQPRRREWAASQKVSSCIEICRDISMLSVNGALFDTITYVSSHSQYVRQYTTSYDMKVFVLKGTELAWETALKQKKYPIVDYVCTFLLQALVCEPGELPSADQIRALQRSSWNFLTLHRLSDQISDSESIMRHFVKKSTFRAAGRSWCLTENGFVGLVPRSAKIGDSVALFYGGGFPFIIRRHSISQNNKFHLVGHGYFHEVMNGEAFDLPSLQPQRIILI